MNTYFVLALLCIASVYGQMGGQVHEMTAKEISEAKDLQTGLDMALEKFNKKLPPGVNRIVRHSLLGATSQVVSGVIYGAKVKCIESTCKNVKENEGKSILECPAKEKAVPHMCMIRVWVRKWMKDEKMRIMADMICPR